MIEPADLLELAGRLLQGTHEAYWRSASSRAYYAALHAARHYCERAKLPLPIGASHERVIEALKSSKSPAERQIGQLLGRLRSERNLADYQLELDYSQRQAQKCHSECQRAVTKLAELAASLPPG
ncbi:MAG TPA: hypothetical protein PKW88_10090 [Plasticicumulans sp.]|nr:hypothetical protein [Plasticicumulans sp.]